VESTETKKARMKRVVATLKQTYPEATCDLTFETPFQLLVATVLSAQCTDDRVNAVTPEVFRRWPDAEALSQASIEEIQAVIRPTGFFNNKSKALKNLSESIVQDHDGMLPTTMDELTALRGVGRKTANVLRGDGMGIPSMVVDTHVGRISRRLAMTRQTDAVKIEFELMELVEEPDWTLYSHLLIYHGRAICSARTTPKCGECVIRSECARVGVDEGSRDGTVKSRKGPAVKSKKRPGAKSKKKSAGARGGGAQPKEAAAKIAKRATAKKKTASSKKKTSGRKKVAKKKG
jgi:endonuclease-3